jgi:hypothetical protein
MVVRRDEVACVSGKLISLRSQPEILKGELDQVLVLLDEGLGSFGLRDEKHADLKAHYVPFTSKGLSSKDKAHPLVKKDNGHPYNETCVSCETHFKWVRRARDGQALSSSLDPVVVAGLFRLESDCIKSAQSNGL